MQILEAAKVLREEMVEDWRKMTASSYLDVLEVCAPVDSPLASLLIEKGRWGLRLGPSTGFDLSTRTGFH